MGQVTARVEFEPDETFPFAPPQARLLDAGVPLEATFHIERSNHDTRPGSLCLWEDDWAVNEAPWLEPAELIERVADWLRRTVAGWPGDDVCDLERYLEPDRDTLVLYDADRLAPLVGETVRTRPGDTPATLRVTDEVRRPFDPGRGRRPRRKDHRLAWVDDLGQITEPVRSWDDVRDALGSRADALQRQIAFGLVDLLVLRYQRGQRCSVLAVRARRSPAGIALRACESADTSTATRQIRAGVTTGNLAGVKVGIVGCGAVGSFAADLLYRSGAQRITLYDHERLRPGNLVRHLAGDAHVGAGKVHAVRACLAEVGLDMREVRAEPRALLTLADAMNVLTEHHVVLDATGNARASSLLATAAEAIEPSSDHTVASACVQRDGDIVRVDRMPLRPGEAHLGALSALDDGDRPRERGCGGPISRTPPGAVIAAAELACRVVIDAATRECSMPASIVDVRRHQPEAPFDQLGWHTSAVLSPGSGTS